MEIRYLIYPLFNTKPVFQQVLLKDGCAFRFVVVVDVVTLTALLGAILHDDVTTLQRIISVGGLPTGVGTHDDALQPRLALHAVEYPASLFADGLFALLALALHPLAILARVRALHDSGRVLTLAVSDVLPHLGGSLAAGFRWLLSSQTIIVAVLLTYSLDVRRLPFLAVLLAHSLVVSRLPFLDALDTFRALRQSQLTGEPMQRGMAHATGFHQSAVLLFGEPLAEPCPLLIGQHPSLDTLTTSLAQLGGEWSVNELCGQHSREWVYLHLIRPPNFALTSRSA